MLVLEIWLIETSVPRPMSLLLTNPAFTSRAYMAAVPELKNSGFWQLLGGQGLRFSATETTRNWDEMKIASNGMLVFIIQNSSS
jgi:hypothetical protein